MPSIRNDLGKRLAHRAFAHDDIASIVRSVGDLGGGIHQDIDLIVTHHLAVWFPDLHQLSDEDIAELLDDEVWANLNLLAPESTICLLAADRLRRHANRQPEHNESERGT